MKNSGDNVFDGIPVAKDEASLFGQYLGDHDFAAETRRAVVQDVRKFARWFSQCEQRTFPGKPGDDQGRDRFQGVPAPGKGPGGRQRQSVFGYDAPILRLAC